MEVINIAAYKFVPLSGLKERRQKLRDTCLELDLKGTILLSTEGINLVVAGSRVSVDSLLRMLTADPEIGQLDVKESHSEYRPFHRMLVKVKREIIASGLSGIDPGLRPTRKIAPKELKRWLDEGRPCLLLDVRNNYEIRVGTFEQAYPADIDHFRQFPDAVERLPAEARQHPVIMFCTGGIRCEKAGPYLENAGFDQVYQLEGGILRYLEQCHGAHYQGECFVFDQRVALDADLRETDTTQCFVCQELLSFEAQQSPHYVPGESCPRCHVPSDQRDRSTLIARQQRLRERCESLPSSKPYTNCRPIFVSGAQQGMTLIELLEGLCGATRQQWLQAISEQLVVFKGQPVDPMRRVSAGERYEHLIHNTIEPEVNADIRIIYEDAALVVIDKPAPLPSHPCGRYNRNTLTALLEPVYAPEQLRIAHRLDANTTGVVLLTRTRHVAGRVQPQFEQNLVRKRYLVRIQGVPSQTQFTCETRIAASPVEAGARTVHPQGQSATTDFSVLHTFKDGTSLLEAWPRTGRTNQIRIHLWDLEFPVVGDPMYGTNRVLHERQTLERFEAPMCLHAAELSLLHPTNGQRVSFQAPAPSWARVSETS